MLGEAATALLSRREAPSSKEMGTENVLAFINLVLALGQTGASRFWLRLAHRSGKRARRSRARSKGRSTPRLPQSTNPAHRAYIAAIWDVDAAELPGPALSACEFSARWAVGGVRALLVFGSNLFVSAPEPKAWPGPSGGVGSAGRR